MPAYYDYLLAAIPAVMLGTPAALSLTGTPFRVGITIGATIAVLFVAHGLFIRAPTNGPVVETVPQDEQPTAITEQPTAPSGDSQTEPAPQTTS